MFPSVSYHLGELSSRHEAKRTDPSFVREVVSTGVVKVMLDQLANEGREDLGADTVNLWTEDYTDKVISLAATNSHATRLIFRFALDEPDLVLFARNRVTLEDDTFAQLSQAVRDSQERLRDPE